MNAIKRSLSGFLTQNNGWILLVILIVIWFRWVMTFIDGRLTMVYLDMDKWILFLRQLGAQLLLFSPVILFCLFRKWVQQSVPGVFYHILWVVVFIGIPFILGMTDIFTSWLPITFQPEIIWMVGIVIILAEVLTAPSTQFGIKIDLSKWQKVASPEWIVIGIFLMWSLRGTQNLIEMNGTEGSFFSLWCQNLALLSVYYVFYWINHYYLVEQIYRKKGLFYYGFAFLGLMIVFFIPLLIVYRYLPGLESFLRYNAGSKWIGPDAPLAFCSIYLGTVVAMMIWTIPLTILIQWFKQSQKIDKLQSEKTESELSLLKQQINPHFFFNTLNNVYSMSLTKDAQTPEAILQLSDLMRYVIYKGRETTVPLSDEIKYLEDYLRLQQLRIHQRLDLRFDQDIEDDQCPITPLLFIILVENAFKHGIEGAEKEAFLYISLQQSANKIIFTCTNSVEDMRPNDPGVGLMNLRKRLALIYPDCHELVIEESSQQFKAILHIEI